MPDLPARAVPAGASRHLPAQAPDAGASGPVRLEAAAVLARAALARGDAATAAVALDTLRTAGDPMIQRAAVATGRAIQLAAGVPNGR